MADRFAPDEARIAAETVDGEAIVIDLTTGVYYSMGAVAGVIWTLIERRHSIQEIAAAVAARYAVPVEQAGVDVERVVRTLLQEELLVPIEDGPPVGGALGPAEALPYRTPEVTIYRDMSALLALDPPMPGLKVAPWQESRHEQS